MTVAVAVLEAPLPTADAATPASATVLAQGAGLGASPSPAVRRVQRILHRRGYSLGRPGIDGRFGPLTAAAVRRMQARHGLVPDGVVGPRTRRVLGLSASTPASPTRTRKRRSSPPRQPASSPPVQTAPPPATPAPRAPATQPSARTAVATSGRSASSPPATILAAVAVLIALAALAVALLRLWRPGRVDLAPIDRELYLEGESERPEVGAFRGLAVATALPSRGADDPRRARYLVDDPLKAAPVWVSGADVRRAPPQLAAGEPVIGYVTAGPNPAAEQQAFMAIETACEQAGWSLEDIVHDQDTGRLVGRPGLTTALERIAAGKARGLVVSDARRLARSFTALVALIEWFREAEAVLVALDVDLNTATVHGHHTASALVAVAGWESERTAARSRRRLARVQAPDRTVVPTVDERAAVIERIGAMRAAGMSAHAIGIQLDNEGVPPPPDVAHWTTTAVKNALEMATAADDSVRDALPRIPHRRR